MGGEVLLVLLGIVAVIWLLVGPVLFVVMWSRVNRVEGELRRIALERVAERKARSAERGAESEAKPAPKVVEDIWLADVSPTAVPPIQGAEDVRPKETVRSGEHPQRIEEVRERVRELVEDAKAKVAGGKAMETSGAPVGATPPGPPLLRGGEGERETSTVEELLAGKWMTWVGAIAVVIGAGFAFKYAIDNAWIGPTARVVMGLLVGAACFAGGAFAILKNYRFLGQGLVGAAEGILYFALFSAYDWYHLIGQGPAFAGLVIVTAAVLAFSTKFNAQATAILGLLGGFITPLMLSTGQDDKWIVFPYLLVLDIGVLAIAAFRQWPALNVLSFAGTALMWLGWMDRHYAPEKFNDTLILLTPFFLVFMLLGMFHNVIRKKAADAIDFLILFATPVAYFAALYAITLKDYADWQGLMAIALAATYLALGVFTAKSHPAGKSVIVALAGIAASFLTIAVPLQLTGHWIAIAWAAEAVIIVEIGLRFNYEKLRWIGFGLLGVVQCILVFYSLSTFGDPDRFQTRFTRTVDPVMEDVLPGTTHTAPPAGPGLGGTVPRRQPVWTDVFNGRSLSFLASAAAMGILAWEYRRRMSLQGKDADLAKAIYGEPLGVGEELQYAFSDLAKQAAVCLVAGVPLTFLALLIVESFAFGHAWQWHVPTYIGMFSVWTAIVGVTLAAMSRSMGPRSLERAGAAVFILLGAMVFVGFVSAMAGWPETWGRIHSAGDDAHWRWVMFNPRGLGMLTAIIGGGLAAWVLGSGERGARSAEQGAGGLGGLSLSSALGVFAHLTGLALLTTETYAQGVIREWHTATNLAITLVWTLYATGTLIVGIYYRAATVRILALVLFLLTTGKVFLYDVWQLDTAIRTFAFVALGVSLLLVSFLYRRFRGRIREWIAPAMIAVAVPAGLMWSARDVQAQEARHAASEAHEHASGDAGEYPLTQLSYRWPITPLKGVDQKAAGENWAKIVLPPDVYGVTRDDVSDLRVYVERAANAGVAEVPFLLLTRYDRSDDWEVRAELINLTERGTATEFVLDLSKATEPRDPLKIQAINSLTLLVDDGDRNYERSVKVYGAARQDSEEWSLLSRDAYLMDVTRPEHRLTVDKVSFSRSRFPYYKVAVENGGKPALRITGAKVMNRVEVRVPRREYEAEIVANELDAEKKQTRVTFDLGYDHLPTTAMRFDFEFPGNFYRQVSLQGTDKLEEDPEKTQWRSVNSGPVYRLQRDGLEMHSREITYAETTGRFLRLTVDNGDDEPLRVSKGTAEGIERVLILDANRVDASEGMAAVYAGAENLGGAHYDLARTIGTYSLEALPELKAGEREANPFFHAPPKPESPWSERNKPVLWGATIAGIVVLGALTVLLLKHAAKGGAIDNRG